MYKTNLKRSLALLPLGSALILQACAPLAIGAGAVAGTTAISTAREERTAEDVYNDTALSSKITYNFQKKATGLFGVVTPTVRGGKVLLTGTLTSARQKAKAELLAREVKGITKIFNKIKVGQDDPKTFAKDVLITSKLKAKLAAEENIHSVNFSLQTIDGVVYVMGLGRSQQEINAVTNIIKSQQDVREVVNYSEVYRPRTPLKQQK